MDLQGQPSDLSVMAGIYEAIQFGLVTGHIRQEDCDNDFVTIMPRAVASVKRPDNQEKHPALAGIRMRTGGGSMRLRVRQAT